MPIFLDYGFCLNSHMGITFAKNVGLEKGRGKKNKKYTCSGGRLWVPKILVGPVGVFLTYGEGLYSHIWHFPFGQICLIIYLIPYSSPW